MDLHPFVGRLKIVTKDLRVYPLSQVMNYAQSRIVDEYNAAINERRRCRIITLKARQLGVSTVIEGLMFSLAMILNRMNGLVISHEADSATHLLGMTSHYWDTWKFKHLYTIRHNSVRHMTWDDTGSSIRIATAKNVGAGRSRTIQHMHGSEVAFWDDPETLMTGLAQSIPMSFPSFIALESTANGIGGYFYDQWNAAVDGETEYVPLFFPWHQHPEYTAGRIGLGTTILGQLDDEERVLRALHIDDDKLAWRRWAIKNLCGNDVFKFHQEYPCVVGETRVPTPVGLIPIEEAEGHFGLWKDQGMKQVITLTTSIGQQITCTPDHLIKSGDDWVKAGDMLDKPIVLAPPTFAQHIEMARLSDLPASRRVLPITDNWGEWLGMFMGDGSCSWSTISFASDAQDMDVVERWEKHTMHLFGVTPHLRKVSEGGVEQRFGSMAVRDLLADLGCIDTDTAQKRARRRVCVPEVIWRSPRSVVEAFVRAVYECDGHNYSNQDQVTLFTKHEQFARDIQLLLLGLGYQARVRRQDTRNGAGYEYTGYTVTMGGIEAHRYNNEVGWIGQRKANRTPAPGKWFKKVPKVKVVSIVPAGERRVFDITTATRDFSASGILVHNCVPEEAFVTSGHNIFPDAELTACYAPMNGLEGYLVDEPGGRVRFQQSIGGPLTIFRFPGDDPQRNKYLVAGDPSRGVLGDFCCAQVLNRRTWEQVAVFRKKVDPVNFGDQMALLGRYYNWAILCPEIQGGGDATISRLISLQYPFLFEHRKAEKIPGQPETSFGWWSGVRAKHEAIGNLLKVVVDHDITIHHHKTYTEMRAYVDDGKGGFKNGADEQHDDTVTALAICITCVMYEASNLNAEMGVFGGSRVRDRIGEINDALGAAGLSGAGWGQQLAVQAEHGESIDRTGAMDEDARVEMDDGRLPWEMTGWDGADDDRDRGLVMGSQD